MDLRTYLFHKRISVTNFAKTLGCSRVHLANVISGKRIPSLMLATSIEMATNGDVKVSELLKQNATDTE